MTVQSVITCHQNLPLALAVTARVSKHDGVPAVTLLEARLGEHDLLAYLPDALKLRLARACEDELFAPRSADEV